MFKCIGVCSKCGKCRNATLMNKANLRKTKMMQYPVDFVPSVRNSGYGIAFDIGTTTVVGMIWNLNSGKCESVSAQINSQNSYGMDVISRITFAGQNNENTEILRDAILRTLNGLIDQLVNAVGCSASEVNEVTICGNTTMTHIFAGYSPMCLGRAPFTPQYTGSLCLNAKDSKLNINTNGKVYVAAGIAGHVGSDITVGVNAVRLMNCQKPCLYIDIGTNGEIVLKSGSSAFTCSTAAGPAFEGASIRDGMRAADGAIEKVHIDKEGVYFSTIGGVPAVGICGSGLIDAISNVLQMGLINKAGKLITKDELRKNGGSSELIERLEGSGKDRRFILAICDDGREISIYQKDIRQVQLTKGAVLAGINILMKEANLTEEDIDKLYIAGAFGNYIDKCSAMGIGLIPQLPLDRIISVGNAAGVGISMALMSEKERIRTERVAEKVKHIELSDIEDFQNVYMMAMAFNG